MIVYLMNYRMKLFIHFQPSTVAVEVWEWMGDYSIYFVMIQLFIHAEIKVKGALVDCEKDWFTDYESDCLSTSPAVYKWNRTNNMCMSG